MSLDLNKIGLLIDEILANETEESLTEWLDKRRQNASKEEKALIKNEKSKTISVIGSGGVGISTLAERLIDLNHSMEKEGFHVAIIQGKEAHRNSEMENLLNQIKLEPLTIKNIELTAPLFLEKESKNYPNPYSKKIKGFKK